MPLSIAGQTNLFTTKPPFSVLRPIVLATRPHIYVLLNQHMCLPHKRLAVTLYVTRSKLVAERGNLISMVLISNGIDKFAYSFSQNTQTSTDTLSKTG